MSAREPDNLLRVMSDEEQARALAFAEGILPQGARPSDVPGLGDALARAVDEWWTPEQFQAEIRRLFPHGLPVPASPPEPTP